MSEWPWVNILQAGAVAVAIAAIYTPAKKWLWHSKRTSSKPGAQDTAWRQLVTDSRERDCVYSVELLDRWMVLKNKHGLTATKKQKD